MLQFDINQTEMEGLRELCIFYSKIYVKAWIAAANLVTAPQNDLKLLKSLRGFSANYQRISMVTLQKMMNHLWFLSEDLVALALFDRNVDPHFKQEMANLLIQPINEDYEATKRAKVNKHQVRDLSLDDFVTSQSRKFFQKLQLPDNFLHQPVTEWEENADFQIVYRYESQPSVTNDHAERGVALVQNFSGMLTKDEEQFQYILQVVTDLNL